MRKLTAENEVSGRMVERARYEGGRVKYACGSAGARILGLLGRYEGEGEGEGED